MTVAGTAVRPHGLSHIHLAVTDVDRAQRFYQEVFGTQRRFSVGADLVFLRTPASKDLIALHGTPSHRGSNANSGGIDHFGFQLLRPADLDAARAVEAAGGLVRERGTRRDAFHTEGTAQTLSAAALAASAPRLAQTRLAPRTARMPARRAPAMTTKRRRRAPERAP